MNNNICPIHNDYNYFKYLERSRDFEALTRLYDTGCRCGWKPYAYSYAARIPEGLQSLKFLHSHGCPWDYEAAANAAMFGRLETLQWLYENGCPFDNEYVWKSAQKPEDCEWEFWYCIGEREPVHDDDDYDLTEQEKRDRIRQQVDVVNWMVQMGLNDTPANYECMMRGAAKWGFNDLVQDIFRSVVAQRDMLSSRLKRTLALGK